ncbi:MAG: ferrous iron transport protein B [Bacteroidota bacterium]
MDYSEIKSTSLSTVALVGNPNSGKSSLFNILSGLNQRVGNFPGVTVERKLAKLHLGDRDLNLIDLPGVNSLYPKSEDERITSDVLSQAGNLDHPNRVLVLTDATQLRRGIAFCMQVMDMGFPTTLVVNMIDLLEAENMKLDTAKLSGHLGIPVFEISVLKNRGIAELKQHLTHDPPPPSAPFLQIPPAFRAMLEEVGQFLPQANDFQRYRRLLLNSSDEHIPPMDLERIRQLGKLTPKVRQQLINNELLVRLDRADEILEDVLMAPPTPAKRRTEQVDRLFTHPVWGYVIFVGILLLIFQSIFAWAEYPMSWIEMGMGAIKDGVVALMPESWLRDLLVDGIITGIEGIVIFVPQIAFLFFFISILEDSGYMARAVYIMDRIMRPFGFSGRSVIPLMGGMACAIPSIMMTRSISSPKERLITILVTPLISCSARIPVYTLLIALFIAPSQEYAFFDARGLVMTGLYFLGFFMALMVAWVFKHVLKYESRGVFVMELPAYRMPQWKNIGLTVGQKSWSFIAEAGKIIFAVSIILWVLVRFGPAEEKEQIQSTYQALIDQAPADQVDSLQYAQQSALHNASFAAVLGKTIEPVIRPLGYDWKIGISLITSFAAREVFVSTMSIIYQQDDPAEAEDEDTGRLRLVQRLQKEKHPETGKPIYSLATVLSLLIFYAFAMQCVSTLAVTRKEAGWKWALIMVTYLSALAYFAAWGTHALVSFWIG